MTHSPISSAILSLTLALVPAIAQESSKSAKIEELLKLTNAEAMIDQINNQMRTMAAKQLDQIALSEQAKAETSQLLDKIMAQFQERLSWAKMKPEYVRAYADVYSEEEIAGILAFYKSPAGQAFLTKMPQLMTKTMEIAQKQTTDLIPELQRITGEKAKNADTKK